MKRLHYMITAGLLSAFTMAACGSSDADKSQNGDAQALARLTDGAGEDGCTLTQGFWKNHPEAWPTSALVLGDLIYADTQLLALLEMPPKGGDASLILAHQFIAARLNVAIGAKAPDNVAEALAAADAWVAANMDADKVLPYEDTPWSAGEEAKALAETLTLFNEGSIGPGHCADVPPPGGSGGSGGSGGCSGCGCDGDGSGGSGGSGQGCPEGIPACSTSLDCSIHATCVEGCCMSIPG